MSSQNAAATRPVTAKDMPILGSLHRTVTLCTSLGRFDDADAILDDVIAVYGRLPPFLIGRFSNMVMSKRLDVVGSLRAVEEVFTPDEQGMTMFLMIRLTLIIGGLAELPGYGRQVEAAVDALRIIAGDPAQDRAMRARAESLLSSHAQKHGLAA